MVAIVADRSIFLDNSEKGRSSVRSPVLVTKSQTLPGIDEINPAIFEIHNITRREFRASYLGNGCDLRIGVTDRFAQRTTPGGNLRKRSRCIALEPEDSPRPILGKHGFRRRQQSFATLALGDQLDAIKDFRLGDGCRAEPGRSLFCNPFCHPGRWSGPHQLGNHIGVEDDQLSAGGAKVASIAKTSGISGTYIPSFFTSSL